MGADLRSLDAVCCGPGARGTTADGWTLDVRCWVLFPRSTGLRPAGRLGSLPLCGAPHKGSYMQRMILTVYATSYGTTGNAASIKRRAWGRVRAGAFFSKPVLHSPQR